MGPRPDVGPLRGRFLGDSKRATAKAASRAPYGPQECRPDGNRKAQGSQGGDSGDVSATSPQSVVTAWPLSPMSPTVSPRHLRVERTDVATLAGLGR